MAEMWKERPSRLLGIEDGYTAWCLDEAIMQFEILLKQKKTLKPKDTKDNTDLLKQMGVT